MSAIRTYIQTHLLEPLKLYPTVIQDTMLEIITQRLEELYEYSMKYPEIISPNKSRLDILQAIADQFTFTIRNEADIQEQVNILENILYVYNRRGSIDTIENMWKYYGGDLPKDVKVVIPSYNLFRYSVSALSGTHAFIKGKSQDGDRRDLTVNSPGVYEIRLTNSNYPIADLREFLLRELVAAGNEIYFTNVLSLDINSSILDSNPYIYNVSEDTFMHLQLEVSSHTKKGLVLGGYDYNALSTSGEGSIWSGSSSILLELLRILESDLVKLNIINPHDINLMTFFTTGDIRYNINVRLSMTLMKEITSYCTPSDSTLYLEGYSYDRQGGAWEPYKGKFVLNKTPLGL